MISIFIMLKHYSIIYFEVRISANVVLVLSDDNKETYVFGLSIGNLLAL